MTLRKSVDVNKLVASCNGDRDAVVAKIELEVAADPEVVLRLADKVQPYLAVGTIRNAMLAVMATDHPERYLPYFAKVQNFFPDEELRERMRGVHHTHPWMFYTHGQALKPCSPTSTLSD